QPEKLERDVRDDLDVDPRVVVDLQAEDGVDVADVPPALELVVAVDALENLPELAVAALGDADPHLRDGLRRRQPGLALRLLGDGLVDPLLDLLVDCHGRTVRPNGAQAAAGAGSGSVSCAVLSWKYMTVNASAISGVVMHWATRLPSQASRKVGRTSERMARAMPPTTMLAMITTTATPSTVQRCPSVSSGERAN